MKTQTELKTLKDICKECEYGCPSNLEFIGFCNEEEIKLNKGKGYIFIITQTKDILNKVLGTPKQNVYVYKKVLKE